MGQANDYVNYFYARYKGRVAISVGYDQNMSDIFPLVFQTDSGISIGIVALSVLPHGESEGVHIYHLGAFTTNHGSGAAMLGELCCQADRFGIYLSVSAVSMPNGLESQMSSSMLRQWYKRFGFKGDPALVRHPLPGP